ncbi:MAG: F0F1 ATP synthase subunit A [Ruminococcus sp.]|uniref:F0F1 ATP synthase subunit A n=1 Tax=Ruminococcus sp. TaxID=41978 RepID=UPI001B15A096|nr:F0F1 ATP synthase subunit A [Ruminococcus sp.]MBO4492939.1 F0F1 ATP synthase subunit A [Ruminococcus sp.]MBO7473289.1 F0F1 ATP synthase subunit A [Ruminococcus sp.]MBP5433952.1 F0F1 ATP synthase subunit A [Ruminococcus sp.]
MDNLMEELEAKTAFTIPIFGGIPIAESCVVTWIIMGALVLLSIILTRKMKKVPTGSQCILEGIMDWLDNFFLGILGHKGKKYLPFLETLIIYIAFANIIGLFGFVPPTKDVNVTAALAGMAIIFVQLSFIIEKGPLKWLKSFLNPINLLDLVTRPLSLCMRLFGNVLGAFVVMELVKKGIAAIGVPVIASAYFDIFDGLLQAYVFVFLTSLYMAEAMEEE